MYQEPKKWNVLCPWKDEVGSVFWYLFGGRYMPVTDWGASGCELDYVIEVIPFLSLLCSPFIKQLLDYNLASCTYLFTGWNMLIHKH